MGSQIERASFALEVADDLLHITPAGPDLVARDERRFRLTNAGAVVARSETPALVDWEHDSERSNGSTEAAGWVESFEVRPSGVWGRVKWTPKGKSDIANGAYRYLSPVLEYNTETREVLSIVSVALTNRPALRMSQVGDVSAFRATARAACSALMAGTRAGTPDVPPEVRARLHAKGYTDERIAEVVAFQAQQRETYHGARTSQLSPTATEAEIRQHCLSRGMTAENYAAAKKDIEDRNARFFGR